MGRTKDIGQISLERQQGADGPLTFNDPVSTHSQSNYARKSRHGINGKAGKRVDNLEFQRYLKYPSNRRHQMIAGAILIGISLYKGSLGQ